MEEADEYCTEAVLFQNSNFTYYKIGIIKLRIIIRASGSVKIQIVNYKFAIFLYICLYKIKVYNFVISNFLEQTQLRKGELLCEFVVR